MTGKRGYNLGKICPCGSPCSNNSVSGLCRPCFMKKLAATPGRGEKISKGLKERYKDPANRAAHREQARRAAETKRANPEWREKAARVMREIVQPKAVTPECLARRDYALTGRLSSEAKMAWVPEGWLDEYWFLRKTKRLSKAEARSIIFAEIRKERERAAKARDNLSPFQRQEAALARGAKLTANDTAPSRAPLGNFGERLAG